MTEKEYNELLTELLKKYDRKKPTIPARVLESNVNKVIKTYSTAYKQLFKELLEQFTDDLGVLANPNYQSQLKLLNMVETRMSELNMFAGEQVKQELEKSYASGQVFHALSSEVVGRVEDLKGVVPYSQLDSYKMEQIVADTMEDLLFVTQHTAKELKKLVRETFSKNLHYHALKGENQKHMKKLIERELSPKMLRKSLEQKGFVGIIDSGGKRWNLRTYIDMAVTTKMNQAYVGGLKDRAIDTGKDLAVIPEKGASDSCKKFEGIIISLTGQTKGYMTYDQLRATGLIFHPRCTHSPCPIGSIDLIHEDDISFHNQKIKELQKEVLKKKKS